MSTAKLMYFWKKSKQPLTPTPEIYRLEYKKICYEIFWTEKDSEQIGRLWTNLKHLFPAYVYLDEFCKRLNFGRVSDEGSLVHIGREIWFLNLTNLANPKKEEFRATHKWAASPATPAQSSRELQECHVQVKLMKEHCAENFRYFFVQVYFRILYYGA